MKALKYTIGLFLMTGMAAGCDDISEQDRYIKEEKPVVENPQTLLIMEFTGNSCMNCPTGARIIKEIAEDAGKGKVITVGLHPYDNINTDPVPSMHPSFHMQDFRSDAATALYKYYAPAGFPAAVFNGQNMSSSTGDWMQRASDALQTSASMSIGAECEYDSTNRELTVNYSVKFGRLIEKKLNLTVWVMENNILGTQTMPDGKRDYDYVHNHVLRTSLNGDWGEPIANLNPGDYVDSETPAVEGSAKGILNEDWKAENCEVVVYVYRDDDKGVEQAVKVPVTAPATED